METGEQHGGMFKSARQHLRRLVYCLFIFSFLLPYVDVVGCSTKKLSTYRGYQLITGTPGALYLAAMALFIAMLVLSFYRKEVARTLRAFGAVWRAMAAAAAGLVIGFLPGIQFLFDSVFMLVGQLLGLACAAAVFADGMVISIREYASLRKEEPQAPGAAALPPALAKSHLAAAVVSLALVPFYCYSLRDEIMIAVMYVLFLSLPFLLCQAIVLQGVRRGERWTLRWAPAVWLFLAGAVALTVASLL